MASFKCEECNIEFKELENLNSHKDTIHMNKKHQCDICKKEFSSKNTLNTHKKYVLPLRSGHCNSLSAAIWSLRWTQGHRGHR